MCGCRGGNLFVNRDCRLFRRLIKMPGHGHSHAGGCCDHGNAANSDAEFGSAFSLYLKIDKDRVQCLNEAIDGSGKDVFKPWDQRLDTEKFVESDADEELLFNIPFTGDVKLKGIIVMGGEDNYHPNTMKLYKNRQNMTFDDVGVEADQVIELHPDRTGHLEYPTKIARFSSIQHLSIYFPSNFGEDTTKVYYIGLKGDFTEARRHEVTITNYEAWANPADHKTDLINQTRYEIQ